MKKNFAELFAELNSAEKISLENQDAVRLAFSELSDEEQVANTENLKNLEAKFSADEGVSDVPPADIPAAPAVPTVESPTPAIDPAPATAGDAEITPDTPVVTDVPATETPHAGNPESIEPQNAPETPAGNPSGEGAGGEQASANPRAPIQANENGGNDTDAAIFKETGMSLTEIKEMQRKFSEMENAQKRADLEKRANSFIFSDANPTGAVLPKAKEKVVNFAAKIPQNLVSEFFEILGADNFNKNLKFGEIGSSGALNADNSLVFSVPVDTPAGFDRESFVLATVAGQFSEKNGVDIMVATQQAAKYIAENGIK